jgi:HlyD family secretion protein
VSPARPPRSPRSRPRLRAAVLAALAVLGAALAWGAVRPASNADAVWVEVKRGDLVLGVPVAGTLAAVDSALLGPPQVPDTWNYKIAFLAPEGSTVRAGTPVLRFDTSELERQLIEKLAEQSSAQKELEKRQASLAIALRDQELQRAEAEARQRKSALKVDVPPELVAAQQLRQSKLDLALAEQEIAYRTERLGFERRQGEAELGALARRRDRAAARVTEMQELIGRMTVRAPRDGTVVWIADRRGEKKKPGDQVWQAEKVVEIPDLRRMRGEGQVEEADAGKVAAGQPVALRLDAHPDVAFPGRVRRLRTAVQRRERDSPQKVVELEIALDRTDPQRMRPGMRFQGTIEVARGTAVVVPADAVLATPEGPLVLRRTLFGSEPVRPRLGRRNERLVEVLAGLAPGDRIAAHPADLAAEGRR